MFVGLIFGGVIVSEGVEAARMVVVLLVGLLTIGTRSCYFDCRRCCYAN